MAFESCQKGMPVARVKSNPSYIRVLDPALWQRSLGEYDNRLAK